MIVNCTKTNKQQSNFLTIIVGLKVIKNDCLFHFFANGREFFASENVFLGCIYAGNCFLSPLIPGLVRSIVSCPRCVGCVTAVAISATRGRCGNKSRCPAPFPTSFPSRSAVASASSPLAGTVVYRHCAVASIIRGDSKPVSGFEIGTSGVSVLGTSVTMNSMVKTRTHAAHRHAYTHALVHM